MNKNTKDKIKNLVASGRTGQAIEVLLQYRSSDKDISNEIISLSARYKAYLREKHGNLQDSQTLGIELNKINNSILHIIEDEAELKIIFFNTYTKIFTGASFLIAATIFLYPQINNKKDVIKDKFEQTDTLEFQPATPLFDSSYLLPQSEKVKIGLFTHPALNLINQAPNKLTVDNIKVIHLTNEINSGFPIYYFTIKNYTKQSCVLNKFSVSINSHIPKKPFGGPKELTPLAIWDVSLPRAEGDFSYKPIRPIEIPGDNSCVIGIRFACLSSLGGKYFPPQKMAEYKFIVNFFDDRGNKAQSEQIKF